MYKRVLLVVSLAAAVAVPGFALADPAQSDTSATMQAPAATTAAPADTATSPAQTAQAAPAQTADSADLDKIECHSSPPATGTRLGATRECHTVREWNQRQQESQRALTRMQSTGYVGKGG
jgi:hypothetical protein